MARCFPRRLRQLIRKAISMNPLTSSVLLGAGGGSLSEEYLGTYVFTTPVSYSTNNFTVPVGCVYIQAFVWGSGGQPDGYSNGIAGGDGGAGGYASAVIPVTEGETLRVGVGQVVNNGGAGKSFGGSGGGFSSVFRGSTPLIIAGGGGGGQVNGTNAGGAGGGTNGQASTDGYAGGTQFSGGPNGSYLQGGSEGGGGGYYGGGGGQWYQASGGGSGYTSASGNLHTALVTGSGRTPPGTSLPDYVTSTSAGGSDYAYGGIGNDSNNSSYGSGLVVIHALGQSYNSSFNPAIPNPRNIIATY